MLLGELYLKKLKKKKGNTVIRSVFKKQSNVNLNSPNHIVKVKCPVFVTSMTLYI